MDQSCPRTCIPPTSEYLGIFVDLYAPISLSVIFPLAHETIRFLYLMVCSTHAHTPNSVIYIYIIGQPYLIDVAMCDVSSIVASFLLLKNKVTFHKSQNLPDICSSGNYSTKFLEFTPALICNIIHNTF